MNNTIKCNRCKVNLPSDKFKLKRCGNYQKNCNECLAKYVKWSKENKKEVKCGQCDKIFTTNSSLKTHIKAVHDKIRDFECSRCEYKCSANGALQQHIKMIHDKIQDFECDKCDYKSSMNTNLKRHIKQAHVKIKNFKCDKCDYKTSTNCNLKQHIKRSHDKIRDHKCEQCNAKFPYNKELKRHLKTCTGGERGSAGEVAIKRVLESMRVEYEYDSTFDELTDYSGKWLRFDFRIPSKVQGTLDLYIEFQGRQHYEPVWGGEEELKRIQESDKIKNEFCQKNNYPLLRIPYTEFENINSLVVKFIRDNTDWGAE